MKNANSDIAYEFIRKRILDGSYAPGLALTTEMLSKEVGVSRTPVRDALRKLEMDGLVVIQTHMGARVKNLTLDDFRELCELRMALEVQTAGLAAMKRSHDELHEMEYAIQEMQRHADAADAAETTESESAAINEMAREDVHFHIAIMSAARNELLKKEILRLHVIHRVALTPFFPKPAQEEEKSIRTTRRARTMREHRQILAAISNSDVMAAKQAMDVHIQNMIDVHMRTMVLAESKNVSRGLTEEELAYIPEHIS